MLKVEFLEERLREVQGLVQCIEFLQAHEDERVRRLGVVTLTEAARDTLDSTLYAMRQRRARLEEAEETEQH